MQRTSFVIVALCCSTLAYASVGWGNPPRSLMLAGGPELTITEASAQVRVGCSLQSLQSVGQGPQDLDGLALPHPSSCSSNWVIELTGLELAGEAEGEPFDTSPVNRVIHLTALRGVSQGSEVIFELGAEDAVLDELAYLGWGTLSGAQSQALADTLVASSAAWEDADNSGTLSSSERALGEVGVP